MSAATPSPDLTRLFSKRMSTLAHENEIKPSALERMLRDRAPGLSEEKRLQMLGEIEAACAGMTVKVHDLRASFDVPVRIFLDHVEDETLIALHSALWRIATRLAGHAGRTEACIFIERLGELLDECVDKIEERFRDVVVDSRKPGQDLLFSDPLDNAQDGRPVSSRGDRFDRAAGKDDKPLVGQCELRRSVPRSVQNKSPTKKAVRRRRIPKASRL
jgi:hypothetical protein